MLVDTSKTIKQLKCVTVYISKIRNWVDLKEIANLTCFVVSISCSLVLLPLSDDMRNSSNLCYPMPFIRKRVNWINLQHFYSLGYGENYHQFIFTFPHRTPTLFSFTFENLFNTIKALLVAKLKNFIIKKNQVYSLHEIISFNERGTFIALKKIERSTYHC